MFIIDSLIKWYLLFPFYHFKLFTVHCIINFILSIFVYKKLYPFYDPQKESIHSKYSDFRRLDKLNYLRLLFGLIVLVWPRLILFALSMIFGAIAVNIHPKDVLNKKDKPWKDVCYSLVGRLVLFSLGNVIVTSTKGNEKKIEEIYKKYLGPDYKPDYDKKFCTILNNHVSWVETYYLMQRYACGFIGKLTASKIPTIREMGVYNQTIYCDRKNPDDRKLTAEKIEKRQRGLMDGSILTNLSIYPEGTITNGTHLIKFKRGAFMTLLPLKPFVELLDQTAECSLSVGALPMHFHFFLVCSYFWHNVTFLNLPVVEPTQYMFDNYTKEGEEKWMTYMNVTKLIMSECSGLKISNSSFEEKLEYLSAITGKKVKNT